RRAPLAPALRGGRLHLVERDRAVAVGVEAGEGLLGRAAAPLAAAAPTLLALAALAVAAAAAAEAALALLPRELLGRELAVLVGVGHLEHPARHGRELGRREQAVAVLVAAHHAA